MLQTAPIKLPALNATKLSNRGIPFEVEPVQQFINRYTPKYKTPANLYEILKSFITENSNGVAVALPPITPCEIIHPQQQGCTNMFLYTALHAAESIFPVYLTLTMVPLVALQFWKLLREPHKMLSRALFSAVRSTTFISLFVSSYMGLICVSRKTLPRDHKIIYFLCGLLSASSILLERKSRRAELALYVLPRAMDSVYLSIIDKLRLPRIPHGVLLLYCFSMGSLMYYNSYHGQHMSPLLRRIIHFFVTNTNNGSTTTSSSSRTHEDDRHRHEDDGGNGDTNTSASSSSASLGGMLNKDTYDTSTFSRIRRAQEAMKSSGSLHILPTVDDLT
jgi:hypothetical protein